MLQARRLAVALLALGLTASPGWSDPDPSRQLKLRLQLVPSDTEVFDKSRPGVKTKVTSSDSLFVVEKPTGQGPSPQVQLLFHHQGYEDQTMEFQWPGDTSRVQDKGVLHLKPYFLTWLALHPFLVGSLTAALLGGVTFAVHQSTRYRKKAQRYQTIENLTASADHRDPYINCILGGHRLVERLGQGGMAWVYKGIPEHSLDVKEAVAIKIIKPDVATDEFKERFRREIQVSIKLNHPNLLRVNDWGEQDDLHYLVMELVEGKPLDGFIPADGCALETLKEWLPDLLSGLCHAHDLGIVHRDIKPENVMLTSSGKIKLMDFGLARSREVKTVTLTGSALGTPNYMAPEQVTLGPGGETLSALSDQYSFGIMLFELACGRLPFVFDEPIRTIMAHINQPCPRIDEFRSDLPQPLVEAVARMVQKERSARFASMREAGQAVLASLGLGDIPERKSRPTSG
jgi:tRNA A-37 threonylcarbamoyl transferase component Bud32